MNKESLKLAKKISHEIWEKYDDTHGYRSEKQDRNKNVSIENSDNIWFFWQQFDPVNQKEFLIGLLSYKDEEGFSDLMDWVMERMPSR